jgi:hypothetical protein
LQGNEAVAIGRDAGYSSQGTRAVAIGLATAYQTQGNAAISIGEFAGRNFQGTNAVAIGSEAGLNSQGINAIAVGRLAGYNSQTANSIALNASGNQLNPATASLYVDPVRLNTSFTGGYLGYNSTTKEIVYNTNTATFGNLALTAATTAASAGTAGDYLRININGTFYKIQLYADA